MSFKKSGVSMTMFIAGLVVAILASSILSTIIATQFAVGPAGPAGPQGEQGPEGPVGGFGAPDYDSGWVDLSPYVSSTFYPNLGPVEDLFVYIIGRIYYGGQFNFYVYHQYGIGGDWYNYTGPFFDFESQGALWESWEDDSIRVFRGTDDTIWEQVRVRIWVID